ncbi:MAG: hypothetical protein K0S11_835 [Gammaproteobacteria bacterium]|jgi:type VI secretion system protein ImpK|nr:hypothetical protein [Gammaproteobacteria bacterium]
MPISDTRFDVHVADVPLNLAHSYWSDYLAALAPIATPSSSYYRSQLYTEKTGINPLVVAAAPLLCLLSRINTHQLQITAEFRIYLEHEFKAFLTQGSQQNYNKEALQMAYHMLNAAFLEAEQQLGDEVIEIMAPTQQNKLDFFGLIEQLQATMPIDLLELGYLIISLGYTGKYRSLPDGKLQLESLRKQLYQQIREQRGEFSKNLSIDEQPKIIMTNLAKQTHSLMLKMTMVTTLTSLTLLCLSFNYVLGLAATPTYQEIQRIQQTLAGSHEPFATSRSS